MTNDPYSYPHDGRGASDDPGLIVNLLSYLPNEIPWEYFVPELNSRFDRWVSKQAIDRPWSPFSWGLQVLFGWRGNRARRNRTEKV